MTAIAVVAKNLAIGKDGKLLYDLPGDLQNYKKLTLGRLCIMGRKTVEGLRYGRPLPGRVTVTMSSKLPADDLPDDALVCGGAQIYRYFWNRTDRLILTEVDAEVEDADAYFPEYRDGSFVCVSDSGAIEENGYTYHIREYQRITKED